MIILRTTLYSLLYAQTVYSYVALHSVHNLLRLSTCVPSVAGLLQTDTSSVIAPIHSGKL